MTDKVLEPAVFNTCKHCGYQWKRQHITKSPVCPNCHSSHWDEEPRPQKECPHCHFKWTPYSNSPKRCPRCRRFLNPLIREVIKGDNYYRVVKLRQENPSMTLTKIAYIVGISRERVRQLLVDASLPTQIPKQTFQCPMCGKQVRKLIRSGFCSLKCQAASRMMTLICDYCGNTFTRPDYKAVYNTTLKGYKGHFFCSRECFGQWVGQFLYKARKRNKKEKAVAD